MIKAASEKGWLDHDKMMESWWFKEQRKTCKLLAKEVKLLTMNSELLSKGLNYLYRCNYTRVSPVGGTPLFLSLLKVLFFLMSMVKLH